MNDIAVRIAEARKAANLSQKELADKLGMRQSQISEIEAGKRDVRLSTLIEVTRALGLELVLVPRQFLPAVQWVMRPAGEPAVAEQQSAYAMWDEEE